MKGMKKMKRRIAVLTSMFLLCACCIMPVSNVSAAFSPRTTAPSYDNQYYYSNLNYYYSIGYGMPNCTAYAYGRAYEILGSKPNLCSNNAGEWWFYNQTYNYYPSGLEPALGAIACWWDGGWSGTRTGHVAVVEGINGDTVVTSNSGYNSTNFWIQNRNKNSMSYDYNGKTYQFLGYIYINDSGGSSSNTPVDLGDDFYAYIEHQYTGMYLTNTYGNIEGATPTGNSNQIWHLKKQSDGSYTFQNIYDASYMDVLGSYTDAGTNIYCCTTYTEAVNQRFFIYYMYGAYYIRPVYVFMHLDMSLSTYNLELWGDAIDYEPQEFNIIIYNTPTESPAPTPAPTAPPTPLPTLKPTPTPTAEPVVPLYDGTVTVGSVSGAAAGDTVTLPVSIKNNPGISSFTFRLNFDKSKVTPVSITKNSALPGSLTSNLQQSGVDLSSLDYVTAVWANDSNYSGDSELFSVSFKINETAADGEDIPIEITYTKGGIVNQDLEDVDVNLISGVISHDAIVYGDIYGDGAVNNKDLVRLRQYLADWDITLTDSEYKAADVFRDGVVNNKDLVRLSQYLADWDVKLGE